MEGRDTFDLGRQVCRKDIIGAATCISPRGSLDRIVRKADALLYAAKKSGKNRIVHEVLGE